MMQTIAHVINAETVHNWQARYRRLEHYADLSAAAHAAILTASRERHGGRSARQLAEALAERFPDELTLTPY